MENRYLQQDMKSLFTESDTKEIRIAIFGLGYVGTVSAACLADMGHNVTGVDVAEEKARMINSGISPIIENGIAGLIARTVQSGKLSATTGISKAVMNNDISIICVGTPSLDNGDTNLTHLETVCREIGIALSGKKDFHIIVVRSTIPPGTMRQLVIPVLEKYSNKNAGIDFGVCNNPEFMREGTAIYDFCNPSRILIGATDLHSGNIVQKIYEDLPGEIIRLGIESCEMLKYADNIWHATKIVFANEIGSICKSYGIDSHTVMDIFCRDKKLNLSSYYLKPGFAFGGSCLPKDIRSINYRTNSREIETPLLASLLVSNKSQVARGVRMVMATGKRTVGFLGISFKAGTDDLRESPLVETIRLLLMEAIKIRVYEPNMDIEKLSGNSHNYILDIIPGIKELLTDDIDSLLAFSEVVVIGNNAPEFAAIANKLRPEQNVIDFVRIREIEESHENYQGICW